MAASLSTESRRRLAAVTWKQVAAFRLSRHHLAERAPAKALIAVARDMAGAQAQLLSAAQVSLWSRVRDLRIAHVEQALSARSLVKASCMRRTLFLVPSEDLAIFVHLLPYFDSFLLGHKEREHLVAMQHRLKVYRAQGWIAPVVLVDGRAAGIWAYTRVRERLRVNVTRFGPISRRITAGIREEAHDLGRFLGVSNVDVQII